MIVGSGGVLSHAPRRNQSMSMMIDSFQPQGITFVSVDSIFMMPHLGVLSKINEKAATEVFEKDCMIYLGTCVAPFGVAKPETKVMSYKINMGGKIFEEEINFGQIKFYNLGLGEEAEVELCPTRNFDLGNGFGKTVKGKVKGGVVGLVFDARGRPIVFPADEQVRKEKVTEWNKILDLYPQY